MKICSIVFLAAALATPLFSNPLFVGQGEQNNSLTPSAPRLVINNRPLIRVNGKVISLIDVLKKMDVIIHEHFPEVKKSVVNLYQFYDHQWQHFLEELVYNELMILDAEQKEIKVSDGDVREEMERRFGPSIIATLSNLKIPYEDARKMIHDELIVRKIQGLKVYSKVQLIVTPEDIKGAYKDYLAKNPPKEHWKYQVVSVRGDDQEECKKTVTSLSEKLKLPGTKLSEITQLDSAETPKVSVSISKDLEVSGNNLSSEHKSVLTSLKEGGFSAPVIQKSRISNTPVYRIFHLKAHSTENPKTFDAIYEEIYNKLLEEHVKIEKQVYQKRLRDKFGFDENPLKDILKQGYKPFELR